MKIFLIGLAGSVIAGVTWGVLRQRRNVSGRI